MDYYKFFTEDNKSGYKSREKWLLKNHPDIYYKIDNINWDGSFFEKISLLINDLTEPPKCPTCGNHVKLKGNLRKGYSKYCSVRCLNSSEEHKKKTEKTNLIKYNKLSHNQSESVKKKKKQSYYKKFGVDNPMKSDIVKETLKETLLNKYNVENPMYIHDVLDKIRLSKNHGIEGNVKRVINRLGKNYTFIKHKDNVFTLKCSKCLNIFNINSNLLNSRIRNKTFICINCNPIKSFNSISIDIINSLSIDVSYEFNNRKLLNNKEIDIYLPEYRLGIEYNGLYWHSNKFKTRNYHSSKTNLAEENNIKLLHIFEDEWLYKKEIVLSIIKSNLKIYDREIDASNCEINEITSYNITRDFLIKNHIDGDIYGEINIGLFHNHELISVIKLSGEDNKYQIMRFCNKLNVNVIGGIDLLFKYFIGNYKSKLITVFLDRRYLDNDRYKQLGLKFIKNTKPNCWHFLQKDLKRIKDISLEDMNKNKFYRIYDSGNSKYELKL